MPDHQSPSSRRRCKAFVLLLTVILSGCGLADKKRSELAQAPAAPDDAVAAPVVLASEMADQDTVAGDRAATTSPAHLPPKPGVIPAGAIEPGAIEPGAVADVPASVDPYARLANALDPKLQATPPLARKVIRASSDDFDEVVLQSDEVVLVDFYADWCGPCKKQAPILEKYAQNAADVTVVKVNTDKSRRVAKAYGVKRLPTLMVFRDGKPVDQHSGLVSEASLKKLVDQARTD